VVELLEAGLLEIEALDDVVDALGSDADRRREDDAMSAQIRTAVSRYASQRTNE
jgi:hypothetical protein